MHPSAVSHCPGPSTSDGSLTRAMRLGTLLLSLAPCLLPSVPLAWAQNPPTPQDTVPQTAADTTRKGPVDAWLLVPVIAAFGAALLFAPPSLLFVPSLDTTSRELRLTQPHVSVYGVGGITQRISGDDPNPWKWTGSASLEAVASGLYAELRIEALSIPEPTQAWTLRGGYLFHPKPQFAGGFTLGYRWAQGDSIQNALEIGLPFAFGREFLAARFEPTYLISSRGLTWQWRFQPEFYIPRSPLMAGLCLEIKRARQGAPYHGTLTLLAGLRIGR